MPSLSAALIVLALQITAQAVLVLEGVVVEGQPAAAAAVAAAARLRLLLLPMVRAAAAAAAAVMSLTRSEPL